MNLARQTFPTSFSTSSSSCGECLIWNSLDDIWDCCSNKKVKHFLKESGWCDQKRHACSCMHCKPSMHELKARIRYCGGKCKLFCHPSFYFLVSSFPQLPLLNCDKRLSSKLNRANGLVASSLHSSAHWNPVEASQCHTSQAWILNLSLFLCDSCLPFCMEGYGWLASSVWACCKQWKLMDVSRTQPTLTKAKMLKQSLSSFNKIGWWTW